MKSKHGWSLAAGAFAFGTCLAGSAWSQVPAPGAGQPSGASPAPLPAPPPAPAPQAGAPAAAPAPAAEPAPAPAPAAAPYVPPAGYRLVPDDEPPREEASERRRAKDRPYEDGDPVPPGYVVRERPRRGLVIAGSIVTGVPWVLSVTAASASDYENKTGFLLVPGVGPWLMLLAGGARDKDCGDNDFCSGSRAGLRAVLVFDGLVQSAGAAMFLVGLMAPRKVLVPAPVEVSVLPMQLSRDGYGIGAVGTF